MSHQLEKKSDYIDFIVQTAGLSKSEATQLFVGMKEAILGTLQSGKTVSVFDLGVLSVKPRAARVGRNPKTGEPLQIAASNAPAFKAAKGLKDAVKESQ